jgi:hypothetical protein
MNDGILESVRESVGSVHMDRPLEAIEARARALRRRRALTGVAAVGLSAGVGLALALSATGLPTRQDGYAAQTDAPAGQPGQRIELAGFTLSSTSDGTVTITFKEVLADPTTLEKALADAGITAIVRVNATCEGKIAPNPGRADWRSKAVTFDEHGPNGQPRVTISKATMPEGVTLSLDLTPYQGHLAGLMVGFFVTGAPIVCTPHPPMQSPMHGG